MGESVEITSETIYFLVLEKEEKSRFEMMIRQLSRAKTLLIINI